MKHKKCKCCEEYYMPSRYTHKQKYCSKVGCKAESNRESSREYRRNKKDDEDYKKTNKASVKRHRQDNPGYSKKYRNKSPKRDVLSDTVLSQIKGRIDVLSDMAILQDSVIKGFVAIQNGVLSDSIADILKQYYIRGSELSKGSSQQLTEIINGETFSHSKSETKDSSQIQLD